ncbi:MAG: protein kinase [Gemmataceae bacterium]
MNRVEGDGVGSEESDLLFLRLVTAARLGSPQAKAELFDEQRDFLATLALGLVDDLAEAEDLAGEVVVEGQRSLGRFEGQSREAFRTWVRRLLIERASQRKQPERDEAAGLTARVEALPGPLAQAIRMRHWDGLSFAEMGRQLGQTEAQAQVLWSQAVEQLAGTGVSADEGGARELARRLAQYDEAIVLGGGRTPAEWTEWGSVGPERWESVARMVGEMRRCWPILPKVVPTDGRTVPGESAIPGTPVHIGRFEVIREIGRGGMGVVYLARDTVLHRSVAVKVLHHLDGMLEGRFLGEAQALGQVQHPNVTQVYETGTHAGQPYLVMEYLPGNLKELVREKLPAPDEAARLVADIARGLQRVHEAGIIHRDVKPANVLLGRGGVPKISDFGLAKALGRTDGPTRSGEALGTPSYMAPEQVRGKGPITVAADVYGLGAVLYELLTGRPPFGGPMNADVLYQVLEEEPVPPRRLNASAPRDLETICLKCLEKESGRRYGSAGELADELGRYLNNEPIRARPAGMATRVAKWGARHQGIAILLGVLAAVVVGALAGLSVLWLEAVDANRKKDEALDELREKSLAEVAARLEADQVRVETEEQLYYSDMIRVQEAWTHNQVAEVRNLLERHQPGAGERDLRGFEWHFWKGYLEVPLRRIALEPRDVTRLTSSPDGKYLVCMGANQYQVMEFATGKKIASQPPDPSGPPSVAVVGDSLLVMKRNCEVEKRPLLGGPGATEQILRPEIMQPADSILMAPGGRYAAQSGQQNHLQVWDLQTGQEVVRAQRPWGKHGGLREFSASGRHLALVQQGQLVVLEIPSGREEVRIAPEHEIGAVAFDHAEKRVVLALSDNTLQVWDLTTGKQLQALKGHILPATVVKFSIDDVWILSGGFDTTVRVWRAADGQCLGTLKGHKGMVSSLELVGPGRQWLASAGSDGMIQIWDFARPTYPRLVPTGLERLRSLEFTTAGTHLVAVGIRSSIRVLEVDTGKDVTPEGLRKLALSSLRLSPAGQDMAMITIKGECLIWNLKASEPLIQLPMGQVTSLEWSPDGKYVSVARQSTENNHLLVEARTGRILRSRQVPQTTMSQAFSPDRKLLAQGGMGFADSRAWKIAVPTVRVDNDQGETVVSWAFPSGTSLSRLAFRPDGRILAASVGSMTDPQYPESIHLREVGSAETLAVLDGPSGRASFLRFSRDGKRLAAGSADGRWRLWETTTWQAVLTVGEGNQGAGMAWAWSADGQLLAMGGPDGVIRVWRVAGIPGR